MRPTIRIVPAALVSLALVAACGGSGGGGGSATPSVTHASMSMSTAPSARPSTDATLEIASPKNGETIHGSEVPLTIKLDGGTIATSASTELVPNEGHLHVTLDDQLISMTSDLRSVIPDVTPGMHLLKVEFVANDHAPFEPRVVAGVSFEVAG